VLGTVHTEDVALGRLVDPTLTVFSDHAREDLLRAASPPADRVRDVVDRARTQREEERQRVVAVHATEAGERAVIAAVAAADREHLGAALAELARHLLDGGERLRHAHLAAPAHDLGQPAHSLTGTVPVRARVRVDDDADPRHVRPPRAPRPAVRTPPGCP